MSFYLGSVRITLRFSLTLFLCLVPMLGGRLLTLLLISIALHEVGHLLFLLGCRAPVRQVELSLRGVLIGIEPELLSPVQTILLNLCGPLANGLAAITAMLLLTGFDAMRFAAVSLAVGAVNLIPFGTTDGAAALEAAVLACRNTVRAEKCLKVVRYAFGSGVLILILLEWSRSGWQWFYLLGVYYFAAALVEERGAIWYHE